MHGAGVFRATERQRCRRRDAEPIDRCDRSRDAQAHVRRSRRRPEPLASLPADVDESVRDAIQGRYDNGLRRDLAWVSRSRRTRPPPPSSASRCCRPNSASLFARNGRSIMVETLLRDYDQGPEFGGLDMDNALGGVIVVLWTTDPTAIRTELGPRLPPCFPILFREVRWSEAELRRWQNAIALQADWFAEIDASLQGVDADTIRNDVGCRDLECERGRRAGDRGPLRGAGGDAPGRVGRDRSGPAAWGTVVGRVLTADGQPVGPNDLMVDYGGPDDPPGWCGGGDIGYGVRSNGSFEYPCHVGRRTVRVLDWVGDGDHQVVASTVVDVRDGREVEVRSASPQGSIRSRRRDRTRRGRSAGTGRRAPALRGHDPVLRA